MVTETEVNSMVQNQQDPKSCDLEPEVAKRNESDVEPEPGTSSQGDAVCTKDLKSQSLAATTVEGESLSDLRKALSSNPDIGPIIQGMLQSKRPYPRNGNQQSCLQTLLGSLGFVSAKESCIVVLRPR